MKKKRGVLISGSASSPNIRHGIKNNNAGKTVGDRGFRDGWITCTELGLEIAISNYQQILGFLQAITPVRVCENIFRRPDTTGPNTTTDREREREHTIIYLLGWYPTNRLTPERCSCHGR